MKEYPRLPMLYFEFKLSHGASDFALPIKKFIREYYGDDGEKYNKEIKEMEALRNSALRPSRDMTGCLTLKRYYSQLYTLYNKVKIMKGDMDIQFTWQDVYTGHPVTGDIQFELEATMYNIGALHAELGALNMRDNAESLRIACTHFQCSVWAFEQLKDHPQNKSKDMSHDIISFIYQTVMAQAQECILEKSIMDNRKSSIISRVAAQVIEYYNSALSVLIQSSLNSDMDIAEIVGSKLFKEWKKFTEFKVSYYSAVCALFMGDACGEQSKTGEQIAWYISGTQHLEQAEKLSKSIGKIEINLLSKALAKKKETAERDNDFVYHQPVPSSDKLTAVKGAPLATGVGFNVSDPEVCGKDIFARLVPIEAHEMASIYSENKDKILREVRREVEEKDVELLTYLSSLQLDKDNLRPIADTIPDELIEICAELSVKPSICRETLKEMEELKNLASEAQHNIDEANKMIEEEDEKEKHHQEKFGKRVPSMIIVEIRQELRKHEETQKKGSTSNYNLSQALEKFSKDIQLLIDCSAKDLERLLPPVTDIPFDEANIKEIEKLLDKVQEMKDQRASLEKQLREEIQSDDVLKHVIAHSKDEIESIFEKELAKYDKTVNLLEKNMTAQENILNALTKASASYGKSRMALNEVNRLRANRIQSLLSSFDNFMKVKENIVKGIEFYKEFTATTGKLLTRLKSVIKVQDEERSQFVEVQIKKETFNMGSLSLANKRLPHTVSSTHPQQPPPTTNGTPKLKDFLPYMNLRNNPSPSPYPISNTVGGYPAGTNQIQSQYPIPPTTGFPTAAYPTQVTPQPQHQQQISQHVPQVQQLHQPQIPQMSQAPQVTQVPSAQQLPQVIPHQPQVVPTPQVQQQVQQIQPQHQTNQFNYQQAYPTNQGNTMANYQNYYYPTASTQPLSTHPPITQQQFHHQPVQQYQISSQSYYPEAYPNQTDSRLVYQNQNYYQDYYQQPQTQSQQPQHPQSHMNQQFHGNAQPHLQQLQPQPQQPQTYQQEPQPQMYPQQPLQLQPQSQPEPQLHQPLQPQTQLPQQPHLQAQSYSHPQSPITSQTDYLSNNQQSEPVKSNSTEQSSANDLLSQFDPLWAQQINN